MTVTAVPLDTLAQRIAQHESQLEALRQQYQARQEQLTRLTRRKEELEAELRRVESDISGLAHGGKRPAGASVPQAASNKSDSGAPKGKTTYASLPDLIVPVVRAAKGQPVTVRHLTDTVLQRGFTTSSRDPYGLVKVRAYELVKKGVLRRAPNGAGLLLAQAKPQPPVHARKPPSTNGKATVAPKAPHAKTPSGSMPRKAAKPSRSGAPNNQRPLREIVLQVLRKSKQPLPARELGKQVLATGYRTDSKDFTNVIWVAVGKLDEVEKAPEGGYRLKKAKK